jgi:hypothetical protein
LAQTLSRRRRRFETGRPIEKSARRASLDGNRREDFVYDAEKDHYTCPAGEHLTRGLVRSDRRGDIDQYRHLTACTPSAALRTSRMMMISASEVLADRQLQSDRRLQHPWHR